MSYDIYFKDPVSCTIIELDQPHQMRGGTYVIGGTPEMWLNVTCNYSQNYRPHGFHLDDLNGKTALDVIPLLERVISELGDETSSNYWDAVDGNAKRALVQLLTMAKMRPDAVIEVCG